MATSTNPGCDKCKHAQWVMTKGSEKSKPRINRNQDGKCGWPMPPLPAIPWAITARWNYRDLAASAADRVSPTPGEGDGAGCQCFEAKS
jgi:hypothetical protein